MRDLELELDEEKRRHAETVKILRKKERQVKEIIIQAEEDHKVAQMLGESLDKMNEKVKMYKRQLAEQVRFILASLQRIKQPSPITTRLCLLTRHVCGKATFCFPYITSFI